MPATAAENFMTKPVRSHLLFFNQPASEKMRLPFNIFVFPLLFTYEVLNEKNITCVHSTINKSLIVVTYMQNIRNRFVLGL